MRKPHENQLAFNDAVENFIVPFGRQLCRDTPEGACPELVEGKAAALFTRGAYWQYVSTEIWRKRRWRIFSTGPCKCQEHEGGLCHGKFNAHKWPSDDDHGAIRPRGWRKSGN